MDWSTCHVDTPSILKYQHPVKSLTRQRDRSWQQTKSYSPKLFYNPPYEEIERWCSTYITRYPLELVWKCIVICYVHEDSPSNKNRRAEGCIFNSSEHKEKMGRDTLKPQSSAVFRREKEKEYILARGYLWVYTYLHIDTLSGSWNGWSRWSWFGVGQITPTTFE